MQRLRPRSRGEQGFSLIELLVVVIILGVLAAIAIPVYLSQRQRAFDGAVRSDLRNAATAQVAYRITHERYAGSVEDLRSEVKFGPSERIVFDELRYAGDRRFCMVAHHVGNDDKWWVFDSDDPAPTEASGAQHCTDIGSF